MARWQYQGKAEVVSTGKETITLDKWEPKYPPMKRGVGLVLSTAILAGACFLVPPSYGKNFSDPALTDKWKPTYVDYHYQKPKLSRANQPTNAVIVPPVAPSNWEERITIDKWKPTYVDYHYQKPFLSKAIQSGSLFWVYWPPTEIVTTDKWLPNYPNQLLPKVSLSRAIQSGSLFKGTPWNAASALETITIDKWQSEYPDFLLKSAISKFRQPDPPFLWVPPSVEIITADKWLGRYPDYFPKPTLSRAIQAGSLFWADIPRKETITLDKWIGQFPDRLFIKAILSRAIQSGSFFSMWPIVGGPPIPTYTIRELILTAIDTRFKTIVTPDTFNAIRQRIVDAIDSRCKTILTAGGYKMNLGSNVFAWRTTPIQSSEIPALVYRDRTETKEPGWGIYENKLSLEIEIYANTAAEIRECIADLEVAIFNDETWGGLALITDLDSNDTEIEQKEDIFVASKIMMTVEYRTILGDPYTQG